MFPIDRVAKFLPVWHLTCLFVATAMVSQISLAQEEPANAPGMEVDWQYGPDKAKLGRHGEIAVPEGYRFTGAKGTQAIMQKYGESGQRF